MIFCYEKTTLKEKTAEHFLFIHLILIFPISMPFLHFKIGRFQKLDHGLTTNLKLYGIQQPPEYNLSNIQTKIHIIYGTNDYVISPVVWKFDSFLYPNFWVKEYYSID